MNTEDSKGETTGNEPTSVEKRPWETPQIHSTEIFESFTLQSCNQTPGDACQGALE